MTHLLADSLIPWYREHGRHNLPWQQNQTAYRVWISEIMLQQTPSQNRHPVLQGFYRKRFPSIKNATANIDDVLFHWSGWGTMLARETAIKRRKSFTQNTAEGSQKQLSA